MVILPARGGRLGETAPRPAVLRCLHLGAVRLASERHVRRRGDVPQLRHIIIDCPGRRGVGDAYVGQLCGIDATGSSTRPRTWPLHRRGDGWRRRAWGSPSYVERESTCLSRAGEEVVPDPEEAIVQMMKLVIAMIVDVQVLQAYLHGEMELITARLPLVDAVLPRDRASSSVGIGGFLLRCHLCFSSPCNPMNKELCRLFRMYNL